MDQHVKRLSWLDGANQRESATLELRKRRVWYIIRLKI